jgi:hypothetical protein
MPTTQESFSFPPSPLASVDIITVALWFCIILLLGPPVACEVPYAQESFLVTSKPPPKVRRRSRSVRLHVFLTSTVVQRL